MKIAGVYPQQIVIDLKVQHAVSEPYGLEIILAVAKKQGHEIGLFLPLEYQRGEVVSIPEEKFINNILDFKPDILALSIYTSQYPRGKRIAEILKEKLPNLIVIAGNRYPTFLKEKIEKPFDFFVVKEGEETFKELLYEIENGKNYKKVKGIVFEKNNQPFFTGIRERIMNLDSLPNALRFPVIHKQIYKGISIPSLSTNPNYAIVEYSRCCYNNCKFCDNAGFWGSKVVFRSAKRVVDEMLELKKLGVDIFYFMDLNFTANKEKAIELCNEMIKSNFDVSWYCMSNIATADNNLDLLKLMKKAGCFKIAWGVESTNDSSLEKMNKTVNKELTTNEQTIRVLKQSLSVGIINQGFYIIGFPWETESTILKDAEKLKSLPLHILNIGIFTPIPLSRFYSDIIKEGYKFDEDLTKHDRNTLIYNHKTLTNDKLKELQTKIYNDFYETPEYLKRIKKTCIIDPRFKKSFNEYFEFIGKEVGV